MRDKETVKILEEQKIKLKGTSINRDYPGRYVRGREMTQKLHDAEYKLRTLFGQNGSMIQDKAELIKWACNEIESIRSENVYLKNVLKRIAKLYENRLEPDKIICLMEGFRNERKQTD
jgi:hypothetical protein